MGAGEHGGSHGAAHSHSHSHASAAQALSAGGKHRRRLAWALVLIGGFFVVELVTALLTGSLALLSDAGHMAADVLTLAAALGATVLAARPDRTGRRSFGSYRLEVFASLLAVLVMLGVSVFVVLEAIGRIGAGADGAHVDSVPMLVVGALGLVVNLAVMRLLRAGAQESLNVKGAYLEVLADTIGSLGVVAAAILVGATGSTLWDTAIALAIGVFVALRALILGREVLSVLGQETPRHLDPGSVGEDLRAVPGVTDVHDLHLWTVTSGMDVLTVHLRMREGIDGHAVLDAAESMLRERHGLDHCTLQIEPEDHRTDQETTW